MAPGKRIPKRRIPGADERAIAQAATAPTFTEADEGSGSEWGDLWLQRNGGSEGGAEGWLGNGQNIA
jgi:hypothetical protein